MKKITIEFPDDEVCEEFIGWFLDGGGDQQFSESCNVHDLGSVWADVEEEDHIVVRYFKDEMLDA